MNIKPLGDRVVIKKLGRLSGYFTAKGMIILRIDGKYSLNVFVKYFMRIKRVTDVSLCKMFLIALMPKKLAFYYINLNTSYIHNFFDYQIGQK